MMKSTTELLDLARAQNGGCSDYRLAQLLGVPNQTVSNYRVGRSHPANPIAMRLADLCGLDREAVVCWVNVERARDRDERELWLSLLSRVQRTKPARLAA